MALPGFCYAVATKMLWLEPYGLAVKRKSTVNRQFLHLFAIFAQQASHRRFCAKNSKRKNTVYFSFRAALIKY